MLIIVDHDDNDRIILRPGDGREHSLYYRHSFKAGHKKLVAHWPFRVNHTEERVYHILHQWLENPHVFDEAEVVQSLVDAGLLDRELVAKHLPYYGISTRAEEP